MCYSLRSHARIIYLAAHPFKFATPPGMEQLRHIFCVSCDTCCTRIAHVFRALLVLTLASVIPGIFLAPGVVYLARAHDTRTPLVNTYTASLAAWDGGGSQIFVSDTRIGGFLTLFVFLYSNGRSFRYQQDLVPSTSSNPFGLQEGRDVNGGSSLPEQRTTGLYTTPQIPPAGFSLPENVGQDALVSFAVVHWLPGRDFFYTLFTSEKAPLWQTVTYTGNGKCNLGGSYAPGFSSNSDNPKCVATFQASGTCVAAAYRPTDGNLSTSLSGCVLSSPGDVRLRGQQAYTALAYDISGTALPVAPGTFIYFSATVSVTLPTALRCMMCMSSNLSGSESSYGCPRPLLVCGCRYALSRTPSCSCSY